jgi:hypothetical protein
MASPFPGMDPYLERHWGDVHHRLITYACDQLRPRLPKELRARIEERVTLESPEGPDRSFVPDLRVFERRHAPRRHQNGAVAVATAEPLVLSVDDPAPQGYIEIREANREARLVTVIEVVSPSNKAPGESRDKYLQKLRELREGRVSVVEIDLLRGGTRRLPVPVERLPQEYRTPYQVCVRRGWQLLEVEIYRVSLRERLPAIRIPLRQTDADAPLDLQALIEQCYENGDYEGDLDYQADPEPPLAPDDARWADALLRKAGVRKVRRPAPRRGRKKH